MLSHEESSNGTHKDKGEEEGPRIHGEEESINQSIKHDNF